MEQFIQDMVREAGEAIRPLFLNMGVKYTKSGEHDVVTEADLLANEILTKRVREKYPEHGIISEEVSEEAWDCDREYMWIFDPLDGTKMFAVGWPMFGVMVALEYQGEIEMGAIYFPVTNEMLFAKRGGGAWLNGKQIHCSDRVNLEGSFGFGSHGYGRELEDVERRRQQGILAQAYIDNKLFSNCVWSIAPGIKALAEGKIDWMLTTGSYWDFAPAKVILEEAGCVFSNALGAKFSPSEGQGIVVGNPEIHRQLMSLLGLDQTG